MPALTMVAHPSGRLAGILTGVRVRGAQGPQAHKAGVTFPKDQAALDRTLLVGNLNPSVTDEQVCTHRHCKSFIL